MEKIKRFTDLNAWMEAHKLVLAIYEISNHFPKTEVFGLVSQMRRAAVSISSNIAEGFPRKGKKEKINFYHISLGSLSELENQIIIACDLGYINKEKKNFLIGQLIVVEKLVNGLCKTATNL